MLDIDHFKMFNDTYGHQLGDAVLRELPRSCRSQSRSHSIDICCRYGGEEFAVIMPELELKNAMTRGRTDQKSGGEPYVSDQGK